MSIKSTDEFIGELFENDILRLKFILSADNDEAMMVAKNNGFTCTSEEVRKLVQAAFGTKIIEREEQKRSSIKLIDDIYHIMQQYEKLYAEKFNEWNKKFLASSGEEHSRISLEYYNYKSEDCEFYSGCAGSNLTCTLNNVLYHLLESKLRSRCKAEDILDSVYSENPQLLFPKINYIPSKLPQPSYPVLLLWCFDEDNLDECFQKMTDYLESCNQKCKTAIFITTKWHLESYSTYADRIKILNKSGVKFTFILFSLLGATEISPDPAIVG